MSSRINSAFPIQAIHYVADILWDRNPTPRRFDGYQLVFHEDFADFHDTFDRYLERHDLTRMVAGYAWKWVTKDKNDDPNLYDIEIDGLKIRWNRKPENWVDPDLSYDESAEKIMVNRASYFDVNGKKTASEKDLAEYVRHSYYVLLTRGILGTHVFVCDGALQAHLRQCFA